MHRAGQLRGCRWPSGAPEGRAHLIFGCELLRRQVAQAGVGTLPIVRNAPAFDLSPGVIERQEDVLVETFFSQPGIETLDIGILDRLARRYKLEFHPMLVSPLIEYPATELWPVVQTESRAVARARCQVAPIPW